MKCVICEKFVRDDDKSVVQRPRIQGLLSLIASAEKRQDNRSREILSQKNKILSGDLKIKYHLDCRKSFTSSQNVHSILQSDNAAGPSNYSGTRFKSQTFDIRKMCLICNSSGTKKKKGMVSVQTGNDIIIKDNM